MITRVHLDPKINKGLELLRRSGKKASLAAAKAEEIISRLQHERIIPDQAGSITKHGELRIKGVMKYDLGSGYRLITYKNGGRLFLLYVGSHDDCHRWIENNRELTADQVFDRCSKLPACPAQSRHARLANNHVSEEEDFDPLADATEQELRQVFCGLTGGPR